MIRIFTTIAATWLFFQSSFAQIQLEISDYHIFDNKYYRGFMYNDFTQVETTPPGPNQFWDYFLLNEDFQDTLTIVKADLTPFYSSFPESEFAITTNNLSFFYESLAGDGATIQGRAVYDPIANTQVITPFETNGISLPYPINYGDSYSFDYKYVSFNSSFLPSSDSSKTNSLVDISISIDANGMLTIPGGTFEVLRFRQTSTKIDSAYSWNPNNGWSFSNVFYDTTITDLFYTKNIGASLLTITTRPQSGVIATNYLKGFVINGTENAILPKVKIFPQPASSEVWVEAEQDFNAQLVDLHGREHRDLSLSKGNTSIERLDLPAGIYFLRLFDRKGNPAGVKKLVFAD
jgi:hypothetical protein